MYSKKNGKNESALQHVKKVLKIIVCFEWLCCDCRASKFRTMKKSAGIWLWQALCEWYFAEELISHKKVIPARAQTQTIWPDCSNTDYSIRDPPPQSSHFLSSPLPSCPLLSCFSPSTLHTHPVFPSFPYTSPPQPFTILRTHEYDELMRNSWIWFYFFLSVVVFVRPYRVIWKKADGCHSSTWRYTKYCQSVHTFYI